MPKRPHYIEPKSPPSSYAIAGVLEGERGAWGKVLVGTAQRSAFLAPGLALAGVRGERLVSASLLGSLSITASLFVLYAGRRGRKHVRRPAPSRRARSRRRSA